MKYRSIPIIVDRTLDRKCKSHIGPVPKFLLEIELMIQSI